MQIRYEQLNSHLQKSLAPIYLIHGAEPFLIEESRRAILTAAKQQGYTEHQSWQVDQGFSWQQLLIFADSLSLFSSKELIELRCLNNQLNETANKALHTYLDNIPPDKILLLITDKLTPSQQKSSWYQALSKAGVIVQSWPLEKVGLIQWLKQRLTAVKLTTTVEGLQLLAERAEGNLLAIDQEIEKLSLLYPQQALTAEIIAETVNDGARFDIFALTDALLAGNGKRIIRILNTLKTTGIEPILILWVITKEIRILTTIAEQLVQNNAIDKILQEQRIWDKRKLLIKQAVYQYKLTDWYKLLQYASNIDQIIKGVSPGNVWDELINLCLLIKVKKL